METSREDLKDDLEELISKSGSDVLEPKSPRGKTSWWNSLRSLTRTDENQTLGLINALAELCAHDDTVKVAHLCHSSIVHVSEERRLDSFCGYRNIQMLMSYVQATRDETCNLFAGLMPTIREIQESIERAWNRGINSYGRDELGILKGTKKYIGTAEIQAFLRGIGIGCKARVFDMTKDGRTAERKLLEAVESYFRSSKRAETSKIVHTDLPPIYLQLPSHSITVVGIERRKGGSLNLLVFDPASWPSKVMKQLVSQQPKRETDLNDPIGPGQCSGLLTSYRRDEKFLRKRGKFETLVLTGPP